MKKAQIEIIGLTIIVILIVLIALFVIRLTILKTPSDNDVIKLNIAANNLFNAIIKTDICLDNNLNDLIMACYDVSNEEFCNQKPCDLAENSIKTMFDGLFEESNNRMYQEGNYKLIIANNEEIVSVGSCDIEKNRDFIAASPFHQNVAGKSIVYRLYLCN